MIELPEAITFARQITEALQGKEIESAVCGSSPHKFAFINRPVEEYAEILPGRVVGPAWSYGSLILVPAEPGFVIHLGTGGEKILYHDNEQTIPKKHQLLLRFTDGTALSVTVLGWGSVKLTEGAEVESLDDRHGPQISPHRDEFTWEMFRNLFDRMPPDDKRFLKFFIITDPGILGIGNGCLQDILFLARIHPRRRAKDCSETDRRALYDAIRKVTREAIDRGGRDTERDLFNRPGGYPKILDSRSVDEPCGVCGTLIERQAFMGGNVYFCPNCQI